MSSKVVGGTTISSTSLFGHAFGRELATPEQAGGG